MYRTKTSIMKWTHIPLLLGMASLISCVNQTGISGTIANLDPNKWSPSVYLIQPKALNDIVSSYTGKVIDSAQIEANGTFKFENLPDAPEPILLQLAIQAKGSRYFNKLDNTNPATSNYFPIVWQNNALIELTANADQFQSSLSLQSPSAHNAALLTLRDIRLQAFQEMEQAQEAHADEHQLMGKEAALQKFQNTLINFAAETEYLLPALVALRWVSTQNDYERVPEFLASQCQKWSTKMPTHNWVVQLCEKARPENLPVMVGARIPDALLPELGNDTTSFYSLMGEKLTILDLWASWCAPCRKENREVLVPLWDKYHDDGFQIVGYALDASEEVWKNAIEKDGALRWKHTSHLQGDDAPFFEVLRIKTIPANFILDAQGKVLAKNLHSEELVKFVDRYFGGSED